jgi:beta-ribofuranosylaminobenzene 5'-phosphate synthase
MDFDPGGPVPVRSIETGFRNEGVREAMTRVRVTAGARLHFGFQNLSLARDRLYSGIGVALADPCMIVTAEPADEVDAADPVVATAARRACQCLDVAGATVAIEGAYPRHVGLGSGTQLALGTYAAIARAHDREPRVREHAPVLGRGGRSGVGVATFEAGGCCLDVGHPAERFTTERPAEGSWRVPAVGARHAIPKEWRFVVAIPQVSAGRSGEEEDDDMRAIVERADPTVGDEIARIVTQRLLPAVAEGDHERFGSAVGEIGRRNGAWYANEQGGTYRPPLGGIIGRLRDSRAISGVGQSSWGPAVYGVTNAERAAEGTVAAREALDAADVEGTVSVRRPANEGARIETVA